MIESRRYTTASGWVFLQPWKLLHSLLWLWCAGKWMKDLSNRTMQSSHTKEDSIQASFVEPGRHLRLKATLHTSEMYHEVPYALAKTKHWIEPCC